MTESPPDTSRRADIPGLLLGVVALGGLTGGFIEAGQRGWLAPLPGALIAAGVVAGVLFVFAERRGLIAFYNEKVDIILDGQLLDRPKTHFS